MEEADNTDSRVPRPAADTADTARLALPPATCRKHRAFLARKAVDQLETAGLYLTHLLDAAERGDGAAAASLRRAASLAAEAVSELRGAGVAELG